MSLTPPAWSRDAACHGANPNLFFPARGDTVTVRAAKRCCAHCPVREACLQYAMDEEIKHGIFGGKSERERRRMRRGASGMKGAA